MIDALRRNEKIFRASLTAGPATAKSNAKALNMFCFRMRLHWLLSNESKKKVAAIVKSTKRETASTQTNRINRCSVHWNKQEAADEQNQQNEQKEKSEKPAQVRKEQPAATANQRIRIE